MKPALHASTEENWNTFLAEYFIPKTRRRSSFARKDWLAFLFSLPWKALLYQAWASFDSEMEVNERRNSSISQSNNWNRSHIFHFSFFLFVNPNNVLRLSSFFLWKEKKRNCNFHFPSCEDRMWWKEECVEASFSMSIKFVARLFHSTHVLRSRVQKNIQRHWSGNATFLSCNSAIDRRYKKIGQGFGRDHTLAICNYDHQYFVHDYA